MSKKRKYVSISGSDGNWKVEIKSSRSPLDAADETFKFESREAAYQCYRQIRKQLGAGL